MKIAVIGNLALDTICRVESLPGVNEVAVVQESQQYFGGWSGNVAVVLKHLGTDTSLFAAAGADFVDSGYRSHLSNLGVNIEGVDIVNEETCAHFTEIKDSQDKSIAFFSHNVEQRHYDRVLERFDFTGFDLVCLSKFGNNEATELFLQRAAEAHKADLAVTLGHILHQENKGILTRLLTSTGYIFLNQVEAKKFLYIFNLNSLQDTFSLPDIRLKSIIRTEGDQGSSIFIPSQKDPIHVGIVKPRRLVSTLGAGDTYIGAFLFGLVKGWGFQKCGEFAATFSSFTLETEGAQTSLPSKEEVDQRYLETYRNS